MRPLFPPAALGRLLHPESIAIVGASQRAGAFGARILENLGAYRGRIYLVNPRHATISGRPCFPSLAALPEAPDCVAIAVGREAVETIVRDCATCRAGGAVVLASGYRETGIAERAAAEARLAALAREHSLPLIGPNCIGFVNYRIAAGVTFSGMPTPPRELGPRAIGIASQSGALGFALAQGIERGVAVSHVLTAGNSSTLDVADYVSFLAAEPACCAVACLFEGMAEPARMLAAAAACRAAGKALVVHKIARGAEGSVAALSHTGALAGDAACWEGALRAAGAIVVEEFGALIETARFFAKAPAPRAGGVAVLATSGGAGIVAADEAARQAVPLPQPSQATLAVLRARVPEYGAARNPCDVTAQVMNDPESFAACAGALLADPAFGALLAPHVFAYEASLPRLRLFEEIAAREEKPVCVPWLTEWLEGPGAREAEAAPHVALFRSMRTSLAALAAWREGAEPASDDPPPEVARLARREVAAEFAAAPGPLIGEHRAKAMLARYGIPMSEDRIARTPAEAIAAADALGYPVAVKAHAPSLAHKSAAGAVRLGLFSPDGVERAYEDVVKNAERAVPPGAVAGVLVSKMAQPGLELIVGARIDPRFGPMVLVGLGGVAATALDDRALAPAPLGPRAAANLCRRLRARAHITELLRATPSTFAKLGAIIARVGTFASDHKERFASLDINPLIVRADAIIAVDALIERPQA